MAKYIKANQVKKLVHDNGLRASKEFIESLDSAVAAFVTASGNSLSAGRVTLTAADVTVIR